MKKILIPIIGLLVLILLTPFILGKMANSNIDKKIEQLRKSGINIQEINKNISYLDSQREYKILLNKHTNNKEWKKINKIVKSVSIKLKLKFRNLPITTADMDIVSNIHIANLYLKNIKIHLTTKNFKDFQYKVLSIENFKIKNFTGVIHKKKYTYIDTNIETFNYKHLFSSQNNKINGEIKDIFLGLVDFNWLGEKWNFKYNSLELKGENSEENLTTHLLPDGKYSIEDKFSAEKFGIKNRLFYIAFGGFDWDLKFSKQNGFKNSNFDLNVTWDKTEYQKALVDGGKMVLKVKILNPALKTYNDLELNMDLSLDETLFSRVMKTFDPKIVNKYFKNNKTHIEIKNGEIRVNGNRI